MSWLRLVASDRGKFAFAFAATTLLLGCAEDPNASAFRERLAQPIPLQTHQDRDISAREPIRALTPQSTEPNALARLGQRLFHDVRLSGDQSISCASCHDLAAGGADGARSSVGIDGQRGNINAPTVLNATFNFRQFWDGRAANLAEQALEPVTNPVEMGAQWPGVVETLRTMPAYHSAFTLAFGDPNVSALRIVTALAEFEATLVTPSDFDRFLLGDTHAIDSSAQRGYELFKDYGCVACHQGINVGGNLFQKFGALQAIPSAEHKRTDRGRANVTEQARDIGVFKVPSLRNVALTAPYFHDGSVPDLGTAIRVMAATQLGTGIPSSDVEAIESFLNSLTGRPSEATRVTSAPLARSPAR